jgi:hypothetical protein
MRYSPVPSPPPFRDRLNSHDSSQGDAGSVSYGSVQNVTTRPDMFESCDWSIGADKEKQYRHELKNSSVYMGMKERGRLGSFLSNAFYAGQSWFAIALVGVLTGTISGMMQIFKAWLFDFRLGVCVSKGFWYSAQHLHQCIFVTVCLGTASTSAARTSRTSTAASSL